MHYTYFKTFKLLFFIASALILISNAASAQTQPAAATAATAPAAVAGVQTHLDKFFKEYDKQGTARAVIDIFKTNKLMDSTRLTGLIVKIDSMRSVIGKYLGKDLIMQRKASNSLVLYSYLLKHEGQPARMTFMFYKPKNDWEIYRLYFDIDVDGELAESSRVTGKP
ncbi:hypothetical protein SAMN05192574_10878 [Mucilaginibacter gossypiicola]|uniref:DUF3887 domain-containing protein n=1 Tax=Mucilaginibacter gossypiicola TaxID=551995 RepID=A0A1H8PP07_9SPHI|nr:hypothetical protein [Mucilaginibacter gossypiicola]SEO43414.1 hypothetical protein SAMN05192574_10878 [Mucilaginibacter gossypiicola]